MTARFTVLAIEGFPTATSGGNGRAPGLSATVVDEITGREMATFRSEEVKRFSGLNTQRTATTLTRARELAAELNEWHARESA